MEKSVILISKCAKQHGAGRSVLKMDVRPADILVMKKPHPCGGNEMYVIRSGMDFKLRCTSCGREFMVARNKIEKRIRQIKRIKTEE